MLQIRRQQTLFSYIQINYDTIATTTATKEIINKEAITLQLQNDNNERIIVEIVQTTYKMTITNK